MSTSGIFIRSVSPVGAVHPNAEQSNAGFRKHGPDLKSGTTAAEQQDVVTLSQEALSSPSASAPVLNADQTDGSNSTASSASAPSPEKAAADASRQFAQDYHHLLRSLQSGDLASAQQSLAQLVQDALSASGRPSSTGANSSLGWMELELSNQTTASFPVGFSLSLSA